MPTELAKIDTSTSGTPQVAPQPATTRARLILSALTHPEFAPRSESELTTEADQLFLGRWVTRGDLRADSPRSKLGCKLVSYHWDDRKLLEQDSRRCWQSFNALMPCFAAALNTTLSTQHSERFWRITIGPWLLLTLEVLCDRFRSIETLRRLNLPLEIALPNPDALRAPVSTAEFRELITTDSYNEFLYGLILQSDCFAVPDQFSLITYPAQLPIPTQTASGFRSIVNECLRLYSRLLPSRLNQIVFVTSYFPHAALCRLQLALGQLPYPRAPEINLTPPDETLSLRERLATALLSYADSISSSGEQSSVASLCLQLAYRLIPRSLLEGHQPSLVKALASFPRSPKAIVVGNAHIADDLAQIWMAEAVSNGTKLLVVQHGGHYGTGRWSSTDEYEISIADRFLSWGWQRSVGESQAEKIRPIDAPKLIGVGKRLRARADGRMLLALNALPRYAYRTYSVPVAGQFLDYLDNIAQFSNCLPEQLRRLLLVRCHPRNWGWHDEARLRRLAPDVELYRGPIRLETQLADSRLFIATHNATTFLETLAANYPTVIFWDERYYELNSAAKPYFDVLKSAGIFHTNAVEAAAHVSRIAESPRTWWSRRETQTSRKNFTDCYARSTAHWKANWVTLLREECSR